MDNSWRGLSSVERFCPARVFLLFAVFGLTSLAATKNDCVIQDVKNAWTFDLDACRPAPVIGAEKAEVVQSLPPTGAVTHLGCGEQRKLDAIDAVLRVQQRLGIYSVKVIIVPQAWTGLYERAVLLISLPALTLVSAEELDALVAHEIGHEYICRQYADAKARGDKKELRRLELICDVIAIRTLARVSVPPKRLQTATEKIFRYNRERLGVPLNAADYPSLNERKSLLKQMSSLQR